MQPNNLPNNPRSILKVSELNAEVSLLLQSGFPLLWVEGEISNLSRPSSGHLYFSLKDSKAQVRCAMFKHKNMRLRINPENGLKVLARVKIGLYEARGEFQLIVEHMEDAGEGQLQKEFEALKKKLEAEGLFDSLHKKNLPNIPTRIGVITSPTGAAIQDVIQVLNRRCPHIPIRIYPVAVQGKQAAGEIAKAILQADHDQYCDVLLLVRGGGSIEDLWSFNEEIVAQAIYQTKTPIVSGVGHEIDFTIADFVSDQRAPTPSAAAELISPDRETLLNNILILKNNLHRSVKQAIQIKEGQLATLQLRLKQQSGLAKIQQQKQQLDNHEIQINRIVTQQLTQRKTKLQHLEQRLIAQSPAHNLSQQQSLIDNLQRRLATTLRRKQEQSTEKLQALSTHLNTISPLATLQRGYSITRQAENVVHSITQIDEGQKLNIMLADGNFDCEVVKLSPKRPELFNAK